MDDLDVHQMLVQALEDRNFDAACWFIDHGVDPRLSISKDGKTTLQLAQKFLPELVPLIKTKIQKLNSKDCSKTQN